VNILLRTFVFIKVSVILFLVLMNAAIFMMLAAAFHSIACWAICVSKQQIGTLVHSELCWAKNQKYKSATQQAITICT